MDQALGKKYFCCPPFFLIVIAKVGLSVALILTQQIQPCRFSSILARLEVYLLQTRPSDQLTSVTVTLTGTINCSVDDTSDPGEVEIYAA